MKSINPYKKKTIFTHRSDGKEEVDSKILTLQRNHLSWSQEPNAKKKAVLNKMAERLRNDQSNLAKIITLEMGKPISESKAEIEKCAWVCEYYAEQLDKLLEPEIVTLESSTVRIQKESIGIILGIMPWNFPFWQVFRFVVPNIAAGNVCLLKHAANVQQSAKEIETIIQKSFEEYQIFHSVIIPSKDVAKLIDDPRIKGVTLTGSEVAGSSVAKRAGMQLKKTVLELGGSDPFVVLDDADLELAAEHGVIGRFLNSGQSCIAAKRFILEKSIAKQYLALFQEKMEKLVVGNPIEDKTDIGPLAKPEFIQHLENQVRSSIDDHTTRIGRSPDETFFYPTMLIEPKPNSPAYNEEFFGPVAIFFIVNSEQEALSLANRTVYGLSASVWSRNLEKATAFANQIQAGSVFINSFSKSDPRIPFGGVKLSGYGRELSVYGFNEFLNIKAISISK